MGLILLEALGALVLLLLIVWWTMFSGRVQGELQAPAEAQHLAPSATPADPSPTQTPASSGN